MLRTVMLDCMFSMPDAEHARFVDGTSLFDFDLAVWDPLGTALVCGEGALQKYQGRPALSDGDSVVLQSAISRRKQEFNDFLNLGRTLVVVATPPTVVWIRSGGQEKSGTGKNQKVTHLVEDADLLSALPFEYEASTSEGIEIELAADTASALWRETKGRWMYRCVLSQYPGKPLFQISGTNLVVASSGPVSSGLVLVIPDPEVDDDETGESSAAQALYSWIEQVSRSDGEKLPDWCSTALFSSEVTRGRSLVNAEQAQSRALARIGKLKAAQAADDQWKQLIASQGSQLHDQVREALALIGFKILEDHPGRSDLRMDYSGQRVVVEVKGLGKSAGEKDAAQLEKWVMEELEEGFRAKGVLVVNAWRHQPPDRRKPAFPAQMLKLSTTRKHCLITGLQLLVISRGLIEGRLDKHTIAKQILSTVGPLKGFDDLNEIFVSDSLDEA